MTDQRGLKNGDRAAWKEFYEELSPRLLTYFRSRRALDAIESEEDLLGETWATVAAKIHTFDGPDSALHAWAFTIGKNLLLNSSAKASRRKTSPTEDFTWHEKEQWEEDWMGIEGLLSHLKESDRELIVLIDLLGFNAKEAGKIVGKSSGSVRIARMRALRSLEAPARELLA